MTTDARARRSTGWWIAVGFATATAIGLLIFGHRYLDEVANGEDGEPLERLIEELTGAYSAAILFPIIVLICRRYRLDGREWVRHLPVHVAALLGFSFVHTSLMGASRLVLFPLAGLGSYDYGVLPVRYAMELSNDVLAYAMAVAVVHMLFRYGEARDREVRAATLEARLSQTQLEVLRLQLDPHFLFNTLNMISSTLYEDPRAADEMIARLSELLRALLRDAARQEVSLEEELAFTDLYLEIMRARFGDRLSATVDVAPDARDALVPAMFLQPLVENAIRHGADPATSLVAVEVRARREAADLVVEVRDRGVGPKAPSAVAAGGIGLSNTADRIGRLYGAGAGLSLESADGGGAVVRVSFPFRPAGEHVA